MCTEDDSQAAPGAQSRPDGVDASALLDAAEEALSALAGQTLTPAIHDDTLSIHVRRLAKLSAMAQAEKLRRIAELNSRRVDPNPSRAASRLMGLQPGISRGEARAEAETAAALERLPATAAAFAAGDIGQARAREAARGLADLDRLAEQGADLPDDAAEQLDELVAAQPTDADRGEIRRAVDEFANRLSADALADRERRAHANRRLWVGPPGPDGTSPIEGRLDVLGRAALTAALDALSRPTGPDDTRTPAQRRHDALITLAERSLNTADLPTVAAQRPHIILTATHAGLDGLPGADPCHLDGHGPVSSATARMIVCDGEVTEIVVDEHGRPLKVKENGRPTRAQRRAVIARDRCCVGCGAPASRCQLHHVIWRRRNGATVVANLTLVCAACHHAIHHAAWTVVITPTGPYRVDRPTPASHRTDPTPRQHRHAS